MQKVHVNASRSYDIFIGGGLLDKSGEYISAAIKARHVCVVTDDNVDPLYSERLMKSLVESGFSAEKYVFPHGDSSSRFRSAVDRRITVMGQSSTAPWMSG